MFCKLLQYHFARKPVHTIKFMSNKKNTKRTAIKSILAATAGVSSFFLWKKYNSSIPEKKKKRLGMLMDLDKCIGCNACTVACKSENGVALSGFRTQVLEQETGEYPNTKRFFLPIMCNHCEDAPCIKACPNKAIIKQENGIVDIDKNKCKGFQLCISACPYGALYMNPDRNPDENNKDYPARAVGKVDKCNLCSHRIDEGKEPSCVNTCPTDARVFGDLNDESSYISQMVKKEKLTGLLENEGTKPNVYYKGGNKGVFDAEKRINNYKTK